MAAAFEFIIKRTKSQEGWLPLLLLVAIVGCLTTAVLEASWVPEASVVVPAAAGGLLFGSVLAKRPLATLPAWLLITSYGALIAFINLANLWPSWAAWVGGWQGLRLYWLQNGALFLDRVGGWATAVFQGQSSQETVVFALGLALTSYFVTAFTCWQMFRYYRPFPGLLAMGLGLAFNGYFSGVQIWWIGLFIALAALLTAVMHFTALEQAWDRQQIDYSDEVRTDLIIHAALLAALLLALAMALPSFSIQRLVQTFQRQPIVQQTELLLERAFGGVSASGGQPRGPDGVGGRGILPRAFLLGDAPELYETVVMTAVVQSEANLAGIHWRALSYDVYTGQGWALSEERSEAVGANAPLPLSPFEAAATVSQTVHWLQDERLTRYTLGLPQQFSQEVESIWRGQADLVRVLGQASPYTAISQFSQASPTMLRETAVANIPPTILARYTALPAELPQRVHDLAQEVTSGQTNPYDQAVVLERFLRQYAYSLTIESPPENADPVDYFLFEQQTGYCDFYASAMVVMARSVGLPARLGIGYLAQPADANGRQIIYQINGHSWAEIYFAGFGWVEFEPTAAFSSPHANLNGPNAADDLLSEEAPGAVELSPPPLPEVSEQRPFPWTQLFILGLLTVMAWWLWRRGQLPAGQDVVVWSYGRLQQNAAKLGNPLLPSQTPQEFLAAFQNHLQRYGRFPQLTKPIDQLQPHLSQLTNLYIRRRYAGDDQSGGAVAWQSWQKAKRPLWLLRLASRLVKSDK